MTLDKCPQCSQPLSGNTSNNVLLNKVLDLLPHECSYDGCEVLVMSGDDHEKWCGYQPMCCKQDECDWTGCVRDICDHYNQNHKNCEILSENNETWCFPNIDLSKTEYFPIFAHGHFFWMVLSNTDKKFVTIDFIYVPNEKIESSFKITLVFGKSKKSYSSSIYVTPEKWLCEEEISMAFVYSRVQSLIGINGELTYSLTVEKD